MDTRAALPQLNQPQDALTNGSLSIRKTIGLQTTLTNKYDTVEVDPCLNGKQGMISDNFLPIGNAQNLQLALDSKAAIVSPTFVGVPSAPTTANSNKSSKLATTEFVHDVIADVVGGAPESRITAKEISTALPSDASYFATLNIALVGKVDKANPVFYKDYYFHGPHSHSYQWSAHC